MESAPLRGVAALMPLEIRGFHTAGNGRSTLPMLLAITMIVLFISCRAMDRLTRIGSMRSEPRMLARSTTADCTTRKFVIVRKLNLKNS